MGCVVSCYVSVVGGSVAFDLTSFGLDCRLASFVGSVVSSVYDWGSVSVAVGFTGSYRLGADAELTDFGLLDSVCVAVLPTGRGVSVVPAVKEVVPKV